MNERLLTDASLPPHTHTHRGGKTRINPDPTRILQNSQLCSVEVSEVGLLYSQWANTIAETRETTREGGARRQSKGGLVAEALVCSRRATAGRAMATSSLSSWTPHAAVRLKEWVWADRKAQGERTPECSRELEGPDAEVKPMYFLRMRRGLSLFLRLLLSHWEYRHG